MGPLIPENSWRYFQDMVLSDQKVYRRIDWNVVLVIFCFIASLFLG